MRNNLKLIINNQQNKEDQKQFFEKDELKIILDLYAKMVSEGSWKDYGLNISSKQVSFSVFRNATENALYKICKNFKPKNKNLKYLITDSNGKILKNSSYLKALLINTNWKDGLCSNGLDAMILAEKLYRNRESKHYKINIEDETIMKDIIQYNFVDCKVLFEILNYLRNNH